VVVWLWAPGKVNWSPGKLLYILDGRVWAETTGSHVPDVPMHLGIQTHVGSNGKTGTLPDSTTPSKVGLQIDWIKVSSFG